MRLPLFKAHKSINIGDEAATEVIGRLEEHVAMRVQDVNAGLEAKLDATRSGLESQFKRLEAKLDGTRCQIAFVGTMLGIVGLALAASPIIAALIK